MPICTLYLSNYRNFQELHLTFPPKGILLLGRNGSGKTNILESIITLCTGKSHRSTSERSVRSFGLDRSGRVSMLRDGKKIESQAEWYRHTPVVSFGPDDIDLVQGMSSHRRRYMDMMLSLIDPHYLLSLMQYRRLLQQKNCLLVSRVDDMLQIEAYDKQLADVGAYIYQKRYDAGEALGPVFTDFYRQISCGTDEASWEYRSGFFCENGSLKTWKNVFYIGLKEAARADRAAGYSTVGPHRDDLILLIKGKPAKKFGSQGQCWSMALSLRLCSLSFLRQHRGNDELILCIDDVLSFLDDRRAQALFPILSGYGQMIVTTPIAVGPGTLSLPRALIDGDGAGELT
jgi:DNA replication and repair protein RecF